MSLVPAKRTTWFALALVFGVVCYSLFAWQRTSILATRHFATPDSMFWDLETALASTDLHIQTAAIQRFAELGQTAPSLLSTVREILGQPQTSENFRWYVTVGIAKDSNAVDLLAQQAISGNRLAHEKLRQLPIRTQAAALFNELILLDPELEAHHPLIASAAIQLGQLGANAQAKFEQPAFLDPFASEPSPTNLLPFIDDALARQFSEQILAKYRDSEMPIEVERLLVRLGRPAVPALIAELDRVLAAKLDFTFRSRILRMFAQLGELAQAAAPTIIRAIEMESINLVLRDALEALVALQPEDRVAAADAVRAANDPERWEGFLFEPIQEWCTATIERLGEPEYIDWLIAEFQRGPAGVAAGQRQASWREARQLGNLQASAAVDVLQQGLNSRWPEVRLESARALNLVSGPNEQALETLCEFILNSNQYRQQDVTTAITYLGEMGPFAQPAGDLLLDVATYSQFAEQRLSAVVSLHQLAPRSAELTKFFATVATEDSDEFVRQMALRAFDLRMQKSDAGVEVPKMEMEDAIALLKVYWPESNAAPRKRETPWLLWLAQYTIKQDSTNSAPLLAIWLTNDPKAPMEARDLFQNLGDDRVAALPVLRQALENADQANVATTLSLFEDMGPLAADAFPWLAVVQHPNTDRVLRTIDPDRYLRSSRSLFEVAILLLAPIGGLLLIAAWVRSRRNRV